MRKTIPVLSTIALMGCNTDPNTIEVATRLTTLNQKHTTLAKSLIAELTREPEAVRPDISGDTRLRMGTRSFAERQTQKNAYGGYIGYYPFWIRLEGGSLKTLNWIGTSAQIIIEQCKNAGNGTVKIAPI